MTFPNLGRKALVALIALLVFVSISTNASATPSPQDPKGGQRSATGQSLRVNVLLSGKPVANASVVIHNAEGATIASGMTDANGSFTTSLEDGEYTVTASTAGYSARSKVKMVQSDHPASVTLTLVAK